MKIASYNISSGGFSGFDHQSKVPHRLKEIQKAVKLIDADIIGLVETFRWDELYSESDLKNLFGYPKVYCVNLQDQRLIKLEEGGGVTVLSRLPETTFETLKIENRNNVMASVGESNIAFVYLDDQSEDIRIRQTNKLLEKMNDFKKTIMLGDFNTFKLSELVVVKKNMISFKEVNPKVFAAYADSIVGMMRGEVVDLIESHGYKDLGEGCGMTFPTKLFPAKTSGPVVRLDYVFASKPLVCSNFFVYRGPLFDKASDHYPISFDVAEK